VNIRAKAMQRASDENPSGMVTVTGLTEEETEEILKTVRALCEDDVEIKIANYLHSKGFVVAGEKTAIDFLLELPVSTKYDYYKLRKFCLSLNLYVPAGWKDE
jgi:malonyl CoA-acyl carrier protein transacylase